ncbi:hypothetical protein GSU68_17195 [Rathayibacter sp. VKM Ac-2759]|uniref:hypothetical protein n=1 Tax=Rathayibacter sp. VKM Ac-2759 TaxID=2609252 RepID=UPI0013162271|nr:hypothetical protein [Rathayibacter sp. VKM Ac-2759]QHC68132.1 hypothetical protein GSU68_17195 [Rathayibacter sp. VKM Ac-2759]
MNRTTTITALACGLLLTSGVAAPAHASPADRVESSTIDTEPDTLLINGNAFTLD